MQTKDAVTSLAALAHESRLGVFRLLMEAGPGGTTPGKVAEALGVSPSTLSFHLKELANAGLVTSRAESRFLLYSVDMDRMASLMAFLTENCCRGMPGECVATMETALLRCCEPPSTPFEKGKSP